MLHQNVRRSRTTGLLLPLFLLAACDTDPTAPENTVPTAFVAETSMTATGTIENRTGSPIPPDARVVIAWSVSATSPDYMYVFGEGKVQADGKSFSISLTAPPPAEALNLGQLGIGVVLLTTDPNLRSGTRFDAGDVRPDQVQGAAARHGVIYKAPNAGRTLDWAERFATGYGVGIGVPATDGFDTFKPVAPASLVLIVDALENLEFVNWT